MRPAQPKLRATRSEPSEAGRDAASRLAEAQARYGVALVLNQEQSLGRQYLQNALRMGDLEPQYQFWAAWTILQAGYPEEAEPILESLFRQLAEGTIPAELKGTLHQISGELYQARHELRRPGKRGHRNSQKAAALEQGGDPASCCARPRSTSSLDSTTRRLARLDRLRAGGQGGPAPRTSPC